MIIKVSEEVYDELLNFNKSGLKPYSTGFNGEVVKAMYRTTGVTTFVTIGCVQFIDDKLFVVGVNERWQVIK